MVTVTAVFVVCLLSGWKFSSLSWSTKPSTCGTDDCQLLTTISCHRRIQVFCSQNMLPSQRSCIHGCGTIAHTHPSMWI